MYEGECLMFRGRKLFKNTIITILCLFAIISASSFFIKDKNGVQFSGFHIRINITR
jgi:hypothetical protein